MKLQGIRQSDSLVTVAFDQMQHSTISHLHELQPSSLI